MKLICDFHIHSALSPCAEAEMTPGNIVGMARLQGLQAIAVTDHQTCGNCAAVAAAAQKTGLLFVPGLEVESSEEIHLVCLLPDLEAALRLAAEIRAHLPAIANREDIFGEQLLMDENDRVTGRESRLLLQACSLSCDELARRTLELGGACLPAHIDRPSNSMLAVFGVIPADFPAACLEISAGADESALRAAHSDLTGRCLIRGSDAHRLAELATAGWPLELAESEGRPTVKAIIKALRHGL